MKLHLTIGISIAILILLNACTKHQANTAPKKGTVIDGRVIEYQTLQSLPKATITTQTTTLHSDKVGYFMLSLEPTILNPLTEVTSWGGNYRFIVSKPGYITQECLYDRRYAYAYALIQLVPNHQTAPSYPMNSGLHIICRPTTTKVP